MMKSSAIIAVLLFVPACAHAQARKPCEELKSEIAAKLEAKSAKSYTLDVVAKDADAGDGKVVGTCDGATKKIVYRREAATPSTAAKATAGSNKP